MQLVSTKAHVILVYWGKIDQEEGLTSDNAALNPAWQWPSRWWPQPAEIETQNTVHSRYIASIFLWGTHEMTPHLSTVRARYVWGVVRKGNAWMYLDDYNVCAVCMHYRVIYDRDISRVDSMSQMLKTKVLARLDWKYWWWDKYFCDVSWKTHTSPGEIRPRCPSYKKHLHSSCFIVCYTIQLYSNPSELLNWHQWITLISQWSNPENHR